MQKLKDLKIEYKILTISAVLLVIWGFFEWLDKCGISLWLFGLGTEELIPYIGFAGTIILSVSLLFICLKKAPAFRVLFIVLFIAFIIVSSLFFYVSRIFIPEYEYHEFTSPNGKHTLVIKEEGFLFSGNDIVYEKVNPFIIMKRKSYGADDGYKLVSQGDYTLTWFEDRAELSSDWFIPSGTIVITFEN